MSHCRIIVPQTKGPRPSLANRKNRTPKKNLAALAVGRQWSVVGGVE
jgi:hypothetical protein